MNNTLNITVDGEALTVPEGISVAAALALTGDPTTRQAVNGDRRAPFCGMGICQECRITVDGELKAERVSTGVSAQTFCIVKSG